MISRDNQLRIIIGLLCVMILYSILINVVDTVSIDSSNLRRLFFNLSNVLVFLYLYKYIRYDLKLKLFFVFISIEVLISAYFVGLALYRLILGMAPDETVFGNYEHTYLYAFGLTGLRLISIIGIAIQLLLNKFSVKKIKVTIQLVGVSFLLQLIGPVAMVYLIGMLHGTTVESSIIDNMYRFTNLFFNLIAYLSMVCLYVLALDQDDADISTEKEL